DYSTFDTNGYRDNSTTQRKQFNGKLSFGPDEKTRVNLVFNQFDMPLAQDPLGLTADQLAANPQQAGTNAEARRVRKIVLQNHLGSSLTHALGADRSISARVYYGTRENTQYQAGTTAGTWIGLNRAYYGLGLQYNHQLRVGEMPVRWAAGYEFDRSREYRQGGAASLGEKSGAPNRIEDNQAENNDLFAQATALVSERYSITGGVRYSSVRMLSDDYYGNGAGSGNVSYSAASPVLGVTWHASDSLNIYANYGRGFETPTLSEVAYTGATGTPVAAFKTSLNASTSQHYEIGAKWVPSPQTRLDLTAFQITTSDEIVVENSTGGKTTYKNSGGTSRTGLEMALRSHLNRRLMATLSASAIDVTYTQGFCTTAGCTTNTVLAGNKLPGIPQHFLFGELLWTGQPLEEGQRKPRLGAQAGIEMISAGRLYANDANSASADGYTTFNLKASHGWAVGKGSLTAYARADNVTDQRYVGSVIVNQSSSQFYEPAPGYNWTLGLRLSLPL
ncbi:MAG: Fe(3+) dicitrate transport protein FecA precursor, partial [Pseudomonadota bacterium]